MSVLELLFALLLVALLAAVAVVGSMVATINRRAEGEAAELARLRAQLQHGGAAGEAQAAELRARLSETQSTVEGVRSALMARTQVEDDARQSLRRLEAVIAGSSTRGAAGENILEEALRHLPPEMVTRNVWVKGKVVEFALRLPGGKLLPIDSKWGAADALQELSRSDLDPARRTQLAAVVEKDVEKRVREVSQYIDPATTAPFALAAVPDPAYAVCRAAFGEAHRRHVIIVGYSMALPYLLALYQLHLQFARSVDVENLQAKLMDVDRQLDTLEGMLENRLQRAIVMLNNAYTEGKGVSARIRASAQSIQVLEAGDGPRGLEVEALAAAAMVPAAPEAGGPQLLGPCESPAGGARPEPEPASATA